MSSDATAPPELPPVAIGQSRGHQVDDISQGEMDDEFVSVCVYWHSCVHATVPQPNNSGNITQLFRYHARSPVSVFVWFISLFLS